MIAYGPFTVKCVNVEEVTSYITTYKLEVKKSNEVIKPQMISGSSTARLSFDQRDRFYGFPCHQEDAPTLSSLVYVFSLDCSYC